MANIIKYTTQNLSATLAGLANGNHATSYTFGFTDAGLVWGGANQYKTGTSLTYSAKLPTYLTPSTTGGTVSYNTYTLQAYASFSSTGLKSNIATQTVEIRQHAIPVLHALSKENLWIGETAETTYEFTYTPYNTATEYSHIDNTGLINIKQTNAKCVVTASMLRDVNSAHGRASIKATSKDPIGASSSYVDVNIYSPITELVFCVNGSYYNNSSSADALLHAISVMEGANVDVYCYYNAAYSVGSVGDYAVPAYNAYINGVTISGHVGQVVAYDTEVSSGRVVTNPSNNTYTANLKLSTGAVYDSKIKLINIGARTSGQAAIPIEIRMQTTPGTATGAAAFGSPNSKDTIVNYLRILTVRNFEIRLSMPTINPGDKTKVTFSGGVGKAAEVTLVKTTEGVSTPITTFTSGKNVSLANGEFEAVIPATLAAGTYYIKVMPDNGSPQYQPITVKHVTLTLS